MANKVVKAAKDAAVNASQNIVVKAVGKEIKKAPIRIGLIFILSLTLLVAFIEALRLHNWALMITIFIIGIVICLPRIISRLAHFEIPLPLGIYAIVFLYMSLFLGELKNYYVKFWWWDWVLHTSSGVAFGIVGFFILYVLYKTENIKTSPKTIAVFSFAFGLAMGALWEIVEFTIDSTLGPISNGVLLQTVVNGCGLADTMKDLIVDAIGALFAAVMGYLYMKYESGIVVKQVTKELKKDNPKLFKKKEK